MPDCPAPPASVVSIQWLIRRDFAEILALDAASFAVPWGEATYLDHLRRRDVIGMVARATDGTDRVLGSMLYRLTRSDIEILRFAVAPGRRREGVGRQLAGKLVGKLSAHRRTSARLLVPEGSLAAYHFWRACGFRAVGVEREAFGTEDGYRFLYALNPPPAAPDVACEGTRDAGREGVRR